MSLNPEYDIYDKDKAPRVYPKVFIFPCRGIPAFFEPLNFNAVNPIM